MNIIGITVRINGVKLQRFIHGGIDGLVVLTGFSCKMYGRFTGTKRVAVITR